MRQMQRVSINGTELAIEAQGSGDPIVLMHPGIVADGLAPLLSETLLSERYQLVHYHRRGYGESAVRLIP